MNIERRSVDSFTGEIVSVQKNNGRVYFIIRMSDAKRYGDELYPGIFTETQLKLSEGENVNVLIDDESVEREGMIYRKAVSVSVN